MTNAGIEFHLGVSVDQVADQESTAAVTFTEDGQRSNNQASKALAATGRNQVQHHLIRKIQMLNYRIAEQSLWMNTFVQMQTTFGRLETSKADCSSLIFS